VNRIFRSFFYALGAILLGCLHRMNPNTAQFRDIILVLHNDAFWYDVGLVGLIFLGLQLCFDGFEPVWQTVMETCSKLAKPSTKKRVANPRSAGGRVKGMFFRDSKLIADVRRILGWSGGGVHKRIDENRELLALLRDEAPDFMAAHPWVVGWVQDQDDFLCELAATVPISEGRFLRLAIDNPADFPRPFPGETAESFGAGSPRGSRAG